MFVACSVALHGGAFAVMSQAARHGRAEAAQPPTPLELVMVEVEAPKPPPVEEVTALPAPKLKRAIKVAAAPKPPPKEDAPPPPNEPPPAEAPPQAALVVGLTMESTTTAGTFAAPVGNTLYGKTEPKAPAPEDAKPYAARFVPIYQVDSEPYRLSEIKPPYPEIARREGIEGTVMLSIVIDADGTVVSAKVISGPGHGLNESALDAMKRCRFKPAIKSGHPVSTEMKYQYTFVLN
jgi:protein TonB